MGGSARKRRQMGITVVRVKVDVEKKNWNNSRKKKREQICTHVECVILHPRVCKNNYTIKNKVVIKQTNNQRIEQM